MKRFPFWFAIAFAAVALTHRARSIDCPLGAAQASASAFEIGDDDDDLRREPAEGLPVPVVPGSKTTEARIEPPTPTRPFPRRGHRRLVAPASASTSPSPELTTVTGRLSATPERALDDARARLEGIVKDRLAPEVPRSWKIPADQLDDHRKDWPQLPPNWRSRTGTGAGTVVQIPSEWSEGLIREIAIVPHKRDYGTVYEASLKVDLSPARCARIVETYRREQVARRLLVLGGVLALVLIVLSAISGYIKADEATKGYYTTSLRLAATLAVGLATAAIYRWLS